MSVLVWVVVTPFAAWAVLRVSGVEPPWPWAPVVAYTPYAAVVAGAGLLLAAALKRRAAAMVALAATVALGCTVLPRSFADGQATAGGGRDARTLRVLAVNLLVGAADAADLTALVGRLRPDVLALQELTPAGLDRLEAAGLRKALPHAVTRPKQGAGGSAVYARHALVAGTTLEFGGFRQVRAVLAHPSGARVEVVSVHPCALRLRSRQPCWRAGLKALPRASGPLRVLAGDFNATLDHALVRELLAGGYRDAADATGHGFTATWPQRGWGPPLPGVAIDHVLADARMRVREFGVHALRGTDHRPVFAVLALP
ncbi:endonuclease/exonuclease/phosphatase family protein [Nonomuraea sp. LPB2021202275-12-8]|uniref:endonuclease/exonuclease/phosphatase family protein n=1 Tax=Nonomuraea sp. LPB2021202275-12-8 TaxID=3120159 RepID=UPI00300CA6B4